MVCGMYLNDICTDGLHGGNQCNRYVVCVMQHTHIATKRCTSCRDRRVLQGGSEDIGLGCLVAPCLGGCVRCNTLVDRCGVCVCLDVIYAIQHMCMYMWTCMYRIHIDWPQSRSTECTASCSLASAVDGATSLWCVRGYIATTIHIVANTGVCWCTAIDGCMA